MPGPRRLADLTWPAVAAVAGRALLAVPLGALEQHGPHLPLGTDALVATALAERLGAARDDVLVAPAVAYGSSGEHAGFPGTLSIGGPTTTAVVLELARSADAFRGVVLVNGHGGNAAAVAAAARTLAAEGREVLPWWPAVPGGDAHAGRTETSILLSIAPHLVDASAAAAGDVRPIAELLPALRAGGVAAVSPNGVLGDPAGASADEGAELLERLGAALLSAVDRRWPRATRSPSGPR